MANESKPQAPKRPADPLEMMKVVQPPAAPPSAPAVPAPSLVPVDPQSEPAGAPAGPPSAPSVALPRVTILEDQHVSLRGQSAWMRKGRVLSPEFVAQHLGVLREHGIKMRIEHHDGAVEVT